MAKPPNVDPVTIVTRLFVIAMVWRRADNAATLSWSADSTLQALAASMGTPESMGSTGLGPMPPVPPLTRVRGSTFSTFPASRGNPALPARPCVSWSAALPSTVVDRSCHHRATPEPD